MLEADSGLVVGWKLVRLDSSFGRIVQSHRSVDLLVDIRTNQLFFGRVRLKRIANGRQDLVIYR